MANQNVVVETPLGFTEQNTHSDGLLAISIIVGFVLIALVIVGLIGLSRICKRLDKPSDSFDPTVY